jgi:uncharacterized protein with PIN domain
MTPPACPNDRSAGHTAYHAGRSHRRLVGVNVLAALQVEAVDFTQDSLPHFVAGAQHHHHKVDAKARLNLGDLFTYALARETALPLFFQGTDFANTAIDNAMALLGYDYSDKGVPQPLSDRQD